MEAFENQAECLNFNSIVNVEPLDNYGKGKKEQVKYPISNYILLV